MARLETCPQHLRPCMVVIDRATARRIDRYVMRHGMRVAVARLGVGDLTLEAAVEQGRMQAVTRDRLLASLTREEARDE